MSVLQQVLTGDSIGFEGGTVGSWTAFGSSTISSSTDQAHTGSRSMKIVTTAAGNGAAINFPSIDASAIGLKASLWIWATVGHAMTLYLVAPSGEIVTKPLTAAAGWNFISVSTDDAPGAGSCVLYVWDSVVATFYIDDCAITEVLPVPLGGMTGVQTCSTVGADYWLIHPTTSSYNCRLSVVQQDDFSEQYEEAEMTIIGRGRKKDYGTRWGFKGQLVAQVWDRTDLTARQQRLNLQTLKAQKRDVYLRNPFGDLWLVTMGETGISRTAGVGPREYFTLTLPYSEVS